MYDREKIIEDFSPLIKASIKKYFANYISYEDAYQDGVVKILELIVDENADTQKEIETSELNKKVREIVSTLPQKQREVIEYKFYKNLKNREIAEKMKIKEDTVKEYYKIAKKKLKVKFIENEIDVKEL